MKRLPRLNSRSATARAALLCGTLLLSPSIDAQEEPTRPARSQTPDEGGSAPPAPPRGPGGFGGFGRMGQVRALTKDHDQDGDGILDATERQSAREFLAEERRNNPRRRGFGPPGGPRGRFGGDAEEAEPIQPGESISPEDVAVYPNLPIFDSSVIRTFFLNFENEDWEAELADFNNTDVDVPATLEVDGKTYQNVGTHFRGLSSFMMVQEGRKRSLNLSLDWIEKGQDIDGYNTFNLLNSHEDPSFLRTILYYQIARDYIPTPKACFVRLVINGENWGIYINAQQFDEDFTKEWFGSKKGRRWKVPGNPGARGGLGYLGEDIEPYQEIYSMKGKNDTDDWQAFIAMLRVLNETPSEQLEDELAPLLNIEGALKFLALDLALINNDGYWVRSSDYNIYRDRRGQFHLIPHDANETFAKPFIFGPRRGFRRGPGSPEAPDRGRPEAQRSRPDRPRSEAGDRPPRPDRSNDEQSREDRGRRREANPDRESGPNSNRPNFGPPGGFPPPATTIEGVKLDPLHIANDDSKALASKLLAVPALRERYLGYVKDIAENWLDWNRLGPIAEGYRALIRADVVRDTRKLDTTEHFEQSLTENISHGGFMNRETIGLKNFADQRREYLLNHPAIKALD